MERIILKARSGYVLTNGEAYGKEIYLGVNDKPENWFEITEEEYQIIMETNQSKDDIL
jgi:hypothetical protein